MLPEPKFETSVFLIPFSMTGILVNLIYIRITTKVEERRKLTDNNVISICVASILNGCLLLIRSGCALQEHHAFQDIFFILNSIQFFSDGVFLCSHLILSIFRYLFIRDIKSPQDHDIRNTQSKTCLKVVIALIFLVTIVYSIYVGVPDTVYVPLICQVFSCVVKLFPFALTVFVHMVSMIRLIYITRKRTLSVHPLHVYVPAGPIQSQEKMKRILHMFTIQIFCSIFPGLFVYSLERVSINLTEKQIKNNILAEMYWIFRGLLVILNPVSFGILLHPRIQFLTSFLDIRKLSNRYINRRRRNGNPGLSTIQESYEGVFPKQSLPEMNIDRSLRHSNDANAQLQSLTSGGRTILPSFLLTNVEMEHTRVSVNETLCYINKSLASLGSGNLSLTSYDSEASVFTSASQASKFNPGVKKKISPVSTKDNKDNPFPLCTLEISSPRKDKSFYFEKSISRHVKTPDSQYCLSDHHSEISELSYF